MVDVGTGRRVSIDVDEVEPLDPNVVDVVLDEVVVATVVEVVAETVVAVVAFLALPHPPTITKAVAVRMAKIAGR